MDNLENSLPDEKPSSTITNRAIINLDDAEAPQIDNTSKFKWPAPQPLTAKIKPEPYPIDALPETIRKAVMEVHDYIKAPIPLITSSALSALSLAIQAHVDVKRADKLESPCSLFMLTIGDSGERKSTCDSFFTKAILEYDLQQDEKMKPELDRYEAELSAWDAEREGIITAIKGASKAGESTDQLKQKLAQVQNNKPESPRVPKLLLIDETPENLGWRLAKQWPSSGVVSSEAGLVLGGHGMGKDSIMRNLALYNVLWDGGEHSVGRKTSDSYTIRGARLTVGLQIQETALREFIERSGTLARGTGYFARFLLSVPASTQGTRFFTEAPKYWTNLSLFNEHLDKILYWPVHIGHGSLKPKMLSLSPEAKIKWIEYHDTIEKELINGGGLYDVRDIASKSADNAARLAALFHVFKHGISGAIDADSFERASTIAAWHLYESRRFFEELSLPVELANAVRLESWLMDYCMENSTHTIEKNHVRQYGPLRNKEKLNAAIKELDELDRIRIHKDGKKVVLSINPALIHI